MQKPADLFLSVIDFLGIFVPGAILVVLHGATLLDLAAVPLAGFAPTPAWAAVAVASYIVGHFLMGLGGFLNAIALKLTTRWLAAGVEAFYEQVKDLIPLPSSARRTRTNAYYAAFSYLRLRAPTAIGEVERQAADYKLFRSLVLVGLLDVPLSVIGGEPSLSRMSAALLVVVLAWLRFVYLLNWTYRLTFEFFALSHSNEPERKHRARQHA